MRLLLPTASENFTWTGRATQHSIGPDPPRASLRQHTGTDTQPQHVCLRSRSGSEASLFGGKSGETRQTAQH